MCAEYETTKNSKVDLTDWGLMQVSGKNAKQFLQGQVTCNLEEINAQQSRLGAYCDVKGRVQATFRLFFYQDAYYFLLPRSMTAQLISSLQKYAVFSKVSLRDASEDWQITGLDGPSITKQADTQWFNPSINSLAQSGHTLSLSVPGPHPRFILLTPNNASIVFNDLSQQTNNHWQLLDIIAGIPTIYPETTGQFTPHQLNYPAIGGVSFNKGCYLGQEIIARTHYLGQSKSRLYRVSFTTQQPPTPGNPLFADKPSAIGTLITSASTEENQYQALACLQTQAISHTIHIGSLAGATVNLLTLPYSI